jgi:hypothetical protein
MIRHLTMTALILPAILAGCVEPAPPLVSPRPMATACDAEAFRYLIGQNKSVLATMGLQGPVRVIGPDTMVTTDFVPTRLNIVHDGRGIIVDVGCY